jgi:Ala-tRNA(Pro) deacylase
VLSIHAELGQEHKFRDLFFPDCKTGAEPPFGSLFYLAALVDTALTQGNEIVFNADSHWRPIRMHYDDYARLVQPRVATFAQHL